jgi:hypothetical protein
MCVWVAWVAAIPVIVWATALLAKLTARAQKKGETAYAAAGEDRSYCLDFCSLSCGSAGGYVDDLPTLNLMACMIHVLRLMASVSRKTGAKTLVREPARAICLVCLLAVFATAPTHL